MIYNFPKHWIIVDLDKVLQRISNGSSLKQHEEFFENSYPISRIETIATETIDLNRVKYVKPCETEIEKYQLLKGDILFSHINSGKHLGKTAIFNIDDIVIHGINLLLIRPKSFYNSDLLNYLFRYYRYSGKFIEVAQHSVNQSSINQKKLKVFKVPVISRAEQDRIVVKVDALMAQVSVMQESLVRIPQLLKDFRQQVLTQAVTGQLTEVSVVEKPLGELLNEVKYGTSKKSMYNIDGTPIFRIPNIKFGEIDDKDLKFSILDEKEFEKLKLKEGDVLLIRSNGSISIVGKCAIVRKKHIDYSYAGYLIRLRCKDSLNSEFLNYSLQSNFLRSQIVDTARSTSGVNNINSTEIKELKILIPQKVKEQQEIVSRVESLFSKADADRKSVV